MRTTVGWQADGPTAALRRTPLKRRDLRPEDLAVRVDYCGVCHSDLHALRSHDGDETRPLVPGHEFTGVVTEIGSAVTRFSVGDPVAVGNIIDSCGRCPMCQAGQENFCHAFPTLTYGGVDRQDGSTTLGVTPANTSSATDSPTLFPPAWIRLLPLHCSAPGSPSGNPCTPWGWGRTAASPWRDWAAWAISRSRSP